MKRFKTLPTVFIIAAGSLWGLMGIFVKWFDGFGISAMPMTFLRALVTAVAMMLFMLIKHRNKLKIRLKDLWMFVGTGLCSIVFFNYCYFQTIMVTSLSVAAILLYTAPIFVMLMSAVLFREKLTARKLTALALAFGGCVLVTGVVTGGGCSFGAILTGLGAGLGYALYSIFSRYALRRYHAYTVTVYTFVIACIGSIPFVDLRHIAGVMAVPEYASAVVVMGLVVSVLPYILYTSGLNHVETGHASIMASVEPVVATLIGIILFHETMTAFTAIGALLVVAAIVVLSLPARAALFGKS